MPPTPTVSHRLNQSLTRLFRDALKISLRNPRLALFLLRALFHQRRARLTRQYWLRQGVTVPPLLIISVTHQCNLRCKGCYAQAHHRPPQPELSLARLREIIKEAKQLGFAIVMLAGGEPLTRPELLTMAADFPELIFPVFTNGLLINDTVIGHFQNHQNVIPVLSIEGDLKTTDERRGAGTYDTLRQTLARLQAKSLFYGVSITVTRHNFEIVTSAAYVQALIENGCKLFFLVEYIAVKAGTEDWLIGAEQRAQLIQITQTLRSRYPALFIAFPGDEEQFGGCLAAGRGFIHVSPEGNLEPCPFSPYSDTNLNEISLKDALQSPLLSAIRSNHHRLSETAGGCALWENRHWVSSLLNESPSLDKDDQ